MLLGMEHAAREGRGAAPPARGARAAGPGQRLGRRERAGRGRRARLPRDRHRELVDRRRRGYPDGEAIPLDEMLDGVRIVASAVELPVTADLERGYGDAGATVARAIEAGAVGCNLEDSDGAGGLCRPRSTSPRSKPPARPARRPASRS